MERILAERLGFALEAAAVHTFAFCISPHVGLAEVRAGWIVGSHDWIVKGVDTQRWEKVWMVDHVEFVQ